MRDFMIESKIPDLDVNSLVDKYLESNPAERPFSYYISCLRSSVKALSENRRLFVILDEVQRWFRWDHTLPERESVSLHNLFKGFVLSRDTPTAHFILTGSAMGCAWNHITRCAPNGLMLSNAVTLNLPGSVSDEMYQAVADNLKSKYPTNIVANIAPHCDNNHALLTFLVGVAGTLFKNEQLELCTNLEAARKFCYKQISEKIVKEMWQDDRHVLGSLLAQERKLFHSLVSASGLSEEDFESDAFGGWRRHLQPFCKVIAVPGKAERHYCLQSVPFRAFVHHFIDENGILVNEPGTLQRDIAFSQFVETSLGFGELCVAHREDRLEASPKLKEFAQKGIQHLVGRLHEKEISVKALKSHEFVTILMELEHVKYPLLRTNPLTEKMQMFDALLLVLSSLRNSIAHRLIEERVKLMKVMGLCPFDFWEALPYLRPPTI